VRGIDEAIRIYDKLLIILSEAAVTSRWVDFEVSTALHREVEQGRTMLFPIRLDDAVLHTPSGWAAPLRSRNIGDFCGWKDHDCYQAAFAGLLRDLTAKEEHSRDTSFHRDCPKTLTSSTLTLDEAGI
jgi:hypothetical protein